LNGTDDAQHGRDARYATGATQQTDDAQRKYARRHFVTADTRLFAAASAEGLAIEDPNAHP
jgi:hypothetical protein